MIKSKIDARERALELAIAYYSGDKGARREEVLATAEAFATYLIGSAELPTKEPTAEDVATKAIERLLSAYGLNSGKEVKPCTNAVSGFPIGGIVPQSEE